MALKGGCGNHDQAVPKAACGVDSQVAPDTVFLTDSAAIVPFDGAGNLAENRPVFAEINNPGAGVTTGVQGLLLDRMVLEQILRDGARNGLSKKDLADIEASIATADRAFGQIVKSIRSSSIGENTIILFTADHGIAFPPLR